MEQQVGKVEEALGTIEESILPGLSHLLDDLLDSAALARPGIDADTHGARLRDTAWRISGLIDLITAVAEVAQAARPDAMAPRRISA